MGNIKVLLSHPTEVVYLEMHKYREFIYRSWFSSFLVTARANPIYAQWKLISVLGEEMLNVFKPDEEFLKNEKNYETIKREILGNQKNEILWT